MKIKDISEARDPDLRGSVAAMGRAAELARQTAIQTGTRLVLVKDGKVTRISPPTMRVKRAKSAGKSA